MQYPQLRSNAEGAKLGHIRDESTECVINTADIDPRYRHVFSLARLQLEAPR